MRNLRRAPLALGVVLAAALSAGCSTGGADGGAAGGGGGGGASQGRAELGFRTLERDGAQEPAAVSARGSGGITAGAASLPRIGPSVIKTATIEMGVVQTDLEKTVREAVQVAAAFGGFVVSTDVDAEGARSGTVVVRVPAARFEQTLSDLEALGKVTNENVSGVDVTQEFVDLQARLRNWQSQEAVLLRLMDRAATVTDTIRVQSELSRVQLEIERLRGRLDYLGDQTDFATITAAFTGTGPAPVGQPSTLRRAWSEAVDGALEVISGVIVGAGYLLPVALLVGLTTLGLRALLPRLPRPARRSTPTEAS